MRFNTIFLFLIPSLLVSVPYNPTERKAWGPWGKDASLSKQKTSTPKQESNLLITAASKVIQLRQEVLTHADGPRSHYFPSSSQYALDALHKYGFFWATCSPATAS